MEMYFSTMPSMQKRHDGRIHPVQLKPFCHYIAHLTAPNLAAADMSVRALELNCPVPELMKTRKAPDQLFALVAADAHNLTIHLNDAAFADRPIE
jgi:hypothetical protein